MRFRWIKAVQADFSHVYCPRTKECKCKMTFVDFYRLGIWVIGVLYCNIILESLSAIFIGKSF